ncbi:unnamed protein product [Mytilus coruscus]|uniref:Dynamin N-terminal domain-containing protein n=1 Tax=Mytilus coruscus TaxID=42192 RepID=A0A6J8B4Q0_MYTCO|nr:unnamed protein product [Mytilus coruscus]
MTRLSHLENKFVCIGIIFHKVPSAPFNDEIAYVLFKTLMAIKSTYSVLYRDTLTFDFKEERENPDKVHKTACSEAANVISRMATFDRKAKSNLYKVYEEIEDIVKSNHFFPEINDEVTAEFGDIIKVIHLQKSDVCEDICPIVIIGETSAGKSTFVNLLLGVELLPQSPLTCTSPICRICNGDNKRIILADSEGIQQNLNLTNTEGVEEIRILLKDYICATKAGEKYKAVDICWPIPCLQNKIMIVDTPGISPDNDILATRLFEYLPSALAFIYIINPTNAGGVQSDRLQRILDEQERRKCIGVKSVFDPRRAIFVCNKWDQMHEDEEKVFHHIKGQLSKKWTNFDSSKMYKISAWEEMQRSKNDQPISDTFKALLRGIDQMIPACLQEKIFRHVSWQRYFLERLHFKLAARIINARRTEDEKRMMAKQVMKRIQKVRENNTAVQSKLKSVAIEQCLKSSEQLYHYLHLPETRIKLCSWTEDDLPEKDDIDKIEKELMCLVEECIAGQIKTWLQETSYGGLPKFME